MPTLNYVNIVTLQIVASGDPESPKAIAPLRETYLNLQEIVYIREIELGREYINAQDLDYKIYAIRLRGRQTLLVDAKTLTKIFGRETSQLIQFENRSARNGSIVDSIQLVKVSVNSAVVSTLGISIKDEPFIRLTMADGSLLISTKEQWEQVVAFATID